ncbi:MAG: hypothetical protein Tsb0010_19210 [Parvularculaceae bacterium]
MTNRSMLLAGAFSVFFLAFLAASTPLGFFMRAAGLIDAGLAFDRAEGTIWRGALIGAQWRERPLGDVRLAVRPLSLAVGRVDLDFEFDGDGVYGRGALSASVFGRVALKDAEIRADLTRFEFNEPEPLAVTGAFSAEISRLVFSRRGCVAADVAAWTDILAQSARALNYSGPPLEARGYCEDGGIVLPFIGRDEDEEVALTLTFDRHYRYRLYSEVRTDDARLDAVLPQFGFRGGAGVYEYERTGRVGFAQPVS